MLSRNRFYHAAVGGWLIASLLPLHGQDNPEKKPDARPAAQTQSQPASPSPVITTEPIRIEPEKAAGPDWNKPKCANAKSHDEADLCEQRRMAQAAEDTVYWSRVGIGVAVIGTVFLIWNLYYVRRATDAAIASADTARAMFVADQRAWLLVDLVIDGPITWEKDGTLSINASARISNVGKTPALNIHTTMRTMTGFDGVPEAVKILARERCVRDTDHSRMLAPNGSYLRPWSLTLEPHIIERERLGNSLYPIVIGVVTYEILYDQELHQTAFAFSVGEKSPLGETYDSSVKLGRNLVQGQVRASVTTGGFAN